MSVGYSHRQSNPSTHRAHVFCHFRGLLPGQQGRTTRWVTTEPRVYGMLQRARKSAGLPGTRTMPAAFSRDGKQVLTGGNDDIARLWDAATGKEIRRFNGVEINISAAFSQTECAC